MLSYCLKCRKNTQSKNPEVVKGKNGRIMLSSKCSACNRNFFKKQEGRGLLSILGIRTPLIQILLLGALFF